MRPLSRDIAAIIADNLPYTFGTNLFVSVIPTKPINCITVIDRPGRGPALAMEGDIDYDYSSVGIHARNKKYDTAYDNLWNIRKTLHGKQGEVRQGYRYEVIEATSNIAQMDQDENGHPRLIINFAVQVTPN